MDQSSGEHNSNKKLFENTNVVEVRNLVKIFPGTVALKGIDFDLKRGEVKGLVGKNGAGKTTLIKILAGLERGTRGTVSFFGRESDIRSVEDSERLGFRFVSQEPQLMEDLTVAENIAFREGYLKRVKLVDWQHVHQEAGDRIAKSGFNLDPSKEVRFLTIPEKQMLLIAREVLSDDAEIVALDEATTSLSMGERGTLFKLIRDQKKTGKSFIYISHEIDEIFEICDTVVVLRDGKVILADRVKNLTSHDLSVAIVGREIEKSSYERLMKSQEEVLTLEDVSNEKLSNVSFNLYKGEIFGVYGLRGSGRTELLKSIFGLMPVKKGKIIYRGQRIDNAGFEKVMDLGVGFLPEEKDQGLFYNRSARENLSMSALKRLVRRVFIDLRKEDEMFSDAKNALSIDTPTHDTEVMYLSGGNKQKIMMGRCLAAGADIYLLDEPTKGIDVGVKYEIYRILRDWATQGKSIIFTSSDLEEIMYVSDRIMVLYNGQKAGILSDKEITKVNLVNYARGVS